jgi:CRP-like cAMP-binding protein
LENIRNHLLASLPASELSLLRRHLREIPMEQGQILEERGEPIDRVHFPQAGMISLIVATGEDSAIEVGTVGHEGAIGMAAGLGSRISSIRALVQVPGTALCISVSRFRAATGRSPRLRQMTVTYGELLLIKAQQTAACNGLHDASSRICRWLLQTSDKTESDVIPFTQEFLGQMLGVQRTTVSEAVSRLNEVGLVDTRYGQIRIVDRPGLEREACECYGVVRRHVDRLLGRR